MQAGRVRESFIWIQSKLGKGMYGPCSERHFRKFSEWTGGPCAIAGGWRDVLPGRFVTLPDAVSEGGTDFVSARSV